MVVEFRGGEVVIFMTHASASVEKMSPTVTPTFVVMNSSLLHVDESPEPFERDKGPGTLPIYKRKHWFRQHCESMFEEHDRKNRLGRWKRLRRKK